MYKDAWFYVNFMACHSNKYSTCDYKVIYCIICVPIYFAIFARRFITVIYIIKF